MTDNGWHLDKRVPIAIIIALIVQGVGLGILWGEFATRVAVVERRTEKLTEKLEDVPASLAEIQTDLKHLNSDVTLIRQRIFVGTSRRASPTGP